MSKVNPTFNSKSSQIDLKIEANVNRSEPAGNEQADDHGPHGVINTLHFK